MKAFLFSRLLSVFPVLLSVSILLFIMVHLAPGDVTTTLLGPMATDEAKEVLRQEMGLDKPLPIQFYNWLTQLASGDFGYSWVAKRPVAEVVIPKFGATVLLAVCAALLAYVIGFIAGIISAAFPRGIVDRTIMTIAMVAGSMPLYWLGLILVYIFALKLKLFPATGMVSTVDGGGLYDVLIHLVLPVVTAALPSAAIVARLVRSAMLEVLQQNYIKVARAKGISRALILRKHALRNALPPIINVCGTELGYLLGGVVFVEVVFAWPGIGFQLYSAIVGHDIPTIQASVLLIALAFVLINLTVDIINAYVDPRIRNSIEGR